MESKEREKNYLIRYTSEEEFEELLRLLEKAEYKNVFGLTVSDWKASSAKVVTAVSDAASWPIICTADTAGAGRYFHPVGISCAAPMAQAGVKFHTVEEFGDIVAGEETV